jgi:glycosyltransferase involved in cell wall biosynthesis
MTSSSTPAVSVILPAYNRAGLIRNAIDSVLRQTFSDFELLVIDDGSTDGTLAETRAVIDPRVRCLPIGRNRGVSAARNAGLAAARGEWVAFQDSDDEWLPTKLEKQMARLGAQESTFVAAYCGMAIVGCESHGAGRTTLHYIPDADVALVEGDVLPILLRTSSVSTQTLVARREALERIGGFDEELRALVDWDCVLRLARLGPFAFVDEPLVLQRFSDNSITRDVARRAVARSQIIEKHRDLLSSDTAGLALHYRILAGEQRRLGDYGSARHNIGLARSLKPWAPTLLGLDLYLRCVAPVARALQRAG